MSFSTKIIFPTYITNTMNLILAQSLLYLSHMITKPLIHTIEIIDISSFNYTP